jgi:hypothetical protein
LIRNRLTLTLEWKDRRRLVGRLADLVLVAGYPLYHDQGKPCGVYP